MALSNTFNFANNLMVDSYITKAFQRCGILGPDITGLQVEAAILDMNLMFSEWANKGLNLFTVEKRMFQINVGQPSYKLDDYTVEALEVTASTNLRVLGGTAFSSAGGVANNCFAGNPLNPTTQAAADGYISYTYPAGVTPAIYYFGIQSYTNTNYTINFEYTLDGNLWLVGRQVPQTLYPINQIIWGVVPIPVNAMGVRIRETGGATLNIAQLYFSQPTQSRLLTAFSREEWTNIPNKTTQAVPSSFYFDRQEDPYMTLWPTPDSTYSTIVYNASTQIMDISQMAQNADIPQRFMEAATSGLAARMALIFAPDKFQLLDSLSQRAFDLAAREDVENVPMRIQPNIWGT